LRETLAHSSQFSLLIFFFLLSPKPDRQLDKAALDRTRLEQERDRITKTAAYLMAFM
jgi:hypothetical protein